MKTIKVGLGTCGVSAGGEKVYSALKDEIARENIPVRLLETGLHGQLLSGGPGRGHRRKGRQQHVRQRDPGQGQDGSWTNRCGRTSPSPNGSSRDWTPPARTRSSPSRSASCCATAASSIPTPSTNTSPAAATRPSSKVLKEYTPEQVIEIVLNSGLRGRGGARLPDRHEVALLPPGGGRQEIHHLQRRRGRPGRLHGPQHAGGRSALGAGRHDDRRLRHRRRRRLHLLSAPNIPWPCSGCATPSEQPRRRGSWAKNIFGSQMNFEDQDQGRRRRLRLRRRDGADRLHRRQARHAALPAALPGRKRGCGASRPTSTTSRPSPTSPGSS